MTESHLATTLPDTKGSLKTIGGSNSDDWNITLARQVVQALSVKTSDEAEVDRQLRASLAALAGIAPKDELEGMMAAQLIAAHNAAMDCYRASLDEQTFEGRREALNQANKLSRTWTTLLDALNRHRGKGQQRVTVEHVLHIHAARPAVVGNIERPGGGDRGKSEDQPHAKQITHAPEPALWGEDAVRDAVPIPRDGERPLSDARGSVSRRTPG